LADPSVWDDRDPLTVAVRQDGQGARLAVPLQARSKKTIERKEGSEGSIKQGVSEE